MIAIRDLIPPQDLHEFEDIYIVFDFMEVSLLLFLIFSKLTLYWFPFFTE